MSDTPERSQQELVLQVALGAPLTATKGWGAPVVEIVYLRARELCEQMGDTPELFPTLWGLYAFYVVRMEHKTSRGQKKTTNTAYSASPTTASSLTAARERDCARGSNLSFSGLLGSSLLSVPLLILLPNSFPRR